MKNNDIAYYQRRALHEREQARMSANEKVALIHLEMAEKYEKMIAKGPDTGGQVEIGQPLVRFGGR